MTLSPPPRPAAGPAPHRAAPEEELEALRQAETELSRGQEGA